MTELGDPLTIEELGRLLRRLSASEIMKKSVEEVIKDLSSDGRADEDSL